MKNIASAKYNELTEKIFKSLKILKFSDQITFKTSQIMHSIEYHYAPLALINVFSREPVNPSIFCSSWAYINRKILLLCTIYFYAHVKFFDNATIKSVREMQAVPSVDSALNLHRHVSYISKRCSDPFCIVACHIWVTTSETDSQ